MNDVEMVLSRSRQEQYHENKGGWKRSNTRKNVDRTKSINTRRDYECERNYTQPISFSDDRVGLFLASLSLSLSFMLVSCSKISVQPYVVRNNTAHPKTRIVVKIWRTGPNTLNRDKP